MPTVKRFEELLIWQIASVQCDEVFAMMKGTLLSEDKPIMNQINAASGSVMDNIAEGFDRFSRAEFRQFLVIARASNAETRSQLYRIRNRAYIPPEKAADLIKTSINLSSRITNLINHLIQSDFKTKPGPGSTGIVHEADLSYGGIINGYEFPIEEIAA